MIMFNRNFIYKNVICNIATNNKKKYNIHISQKRRFSSSNFNPNNFNPNNPPDIIGKIFMFGAAVYIIKHFNDGFPPSSSY